MTHDSYSRNMARGNIISSVHLDMRLNTVISVIPVKIKRILDMGCGEGYFLQKLLDSRNSVKAIGIDISKTNLNFAKKLVPDAEFLVAPVEKTPFKASSFDVVTCLEVLDHVHDLNVVIKEISRVLKPGGVFILSIPAYNNPLWLPIWNLWTLTFGRKWRQSHDDHFNIPNLIGLLNKNQFTHIRSQSSFFSLIKVISCQRKKN